MRNKLNILCVCIAFLNATAQQTSHNLIFEKDQTELTLSQKEELNTLMSRLYDGEKLSIYPVTVDAGSNKYRYSQNANEQALAIANYAETVGFDLLGVPRNFPSNHDGISVSVNLKYHKPQYLDAGEQAYTLQANYPEKESQFFLIDPLKDTTIYGVEGTIVHIPARALTTKMKVEVELKEFYKMADMMINDLSTVSNGSMIETGGSIYLDAKEHKTQKNVSINPQIGLDVAFTNGKDDPEMEIFIKDPSSTRMNWIRPRRVTSSVTRKWSMTETLLDMDGTVISTKTYNSKKEWDDHLKEEADKKKAEEVIVAKKQENYERLKVYDLGYINCDKFPNEAKMQFAVTADDSLVAEYFIVFDDVKGVLKGNTQGRMVSFGEVPKERSGTLVAVAFYGDKSYFYKKSVVLKNAQTAKVQLQPVAKSYVDQQLAMLR
jgi:hypothetical protein